MLLFPRAYSKPSKDALFSKLGPTSALVLALSGLSGLLAGCGASDQNDTRPGGFSSSSSDVTQGPCEESSVQDCSIYRTLSNGSLWCTFGTQTCVDGSWSECLHSSDTLQGKSSGLHGRLTSVVGTGTVVGSSSECSDNACDPECRIFDDTDTNLETTDTSGGTATTPDWSTPEGRAACEHELCDTGEELDPSCHPCVQKVCDSDPSCCTDTGGSNEWNSACAALVDSLCEASPNIPAPPSPCDGTDVYDAGASYGSTNQVQFNGDLYECVGTAFNVYCSGNAPDTALGGLGWASVESCAATGTSCKIVLDLPEVIPTENEPCQSGLDCQVNHRCEDVATGSECLHSKCTEGTALDASCDPCVERICETNPSCCSDDGDLDTFEWDESCTDLVKTECDADCGASTGTACSHQLCDTGAALDADCTDCASTVCEEEGFEYCCDTSSGPGWDDFCVTAATRFCAESSDSASGDGSHRCDYALLGAGSLAMYGATIRGGDVGGGVGSTTVYALHGVRPYLTGSVYSHGALALHDPLIMGDAEAKGTIDSAACSDLVAGNCASGITVPSASVPSKALSCSSGTTTISSDGTLPAGNYGDVTVSAGVHVTFEPGPFQMTSLTVEDGALIELPPSGTVYLDVCSDIAIGQDVEALGASSNLDAFRFLAYTNGNFSLGSRSEFYGMVTAPTGQGTLSQGDATDKTILHGMLHLSSANVYKYAEIDATGLSGDDCAAILSPPSSTCPEAVGASAPPSGEGLCEKNTEDHLDAECSGVDLALDYDCSGEVMVCNHGDSDAPAGVEVGFYSRASQQFATDEPDPNWLLGSCTISEAVPSQSCVRQACDSALTAEEAFLMVNYDDGLPGGECSRLDNWSYNDPAVSCSGAPSTTTEIRTYNTDCPDGMSPLWGMLTWDTTTEGNSNIIWSARTAASESELADETFVEVGVAEANSDPSLSTEKCLLDEASVDCTVDLTEALGLGRVQPEMLELSIELTPQGMKVPTVHDWTLTYSCAVDE